MFVKNRQRIERFDSRDEHSNAQQVNDVIMTICMPKNDETLSERVITKLIRTVEGILCLSSNDIFVEKHFVDKILVEASCQQDILSKIFVDITLRRQKTSSTEHFVYGIFP